MTCDVVRNLLLYVSDPHRVPADLRAHLDACPACTAELAKLVQLETTIARIPVPPSSHEVKTAFLEQILSPEPVIAHIPTIPRHDGRPSWFRSVRREHVAGLAAGLLVAVGVGWVATRERHTDPVTPAPLVRHDLLGKEVRHLVTLANANGPSARLVVWSSVTADLQDEVGKVYRHAPADDMRALERMLDAAVTKGVVPQATQLPAHLPAAERQTLLRNATAQLATTEDETTRMASQAPPMAKPVLERMANTARTGRQTLEKLARGERG